jgi:creatinine amidohydrolase
VSIPSFELGTFTTLEVQAFLGTGRAVVLLPLGSTEPHGPHLPLCTDVTISHVACVRAVPLLASQGHPAAIAPSVPYGVTDFAAGFAGAVGVPAAALEAFLSAIVASWLSQGAAHVCLVNNHLEPAHDQAVRQVAKAFPSTRVSVACPLTRKWGRTLSAEFKSGACHAGQYETSLVLSADASLVRDAYRSLPALSHSLSVAIAAGKHTFIEAGMADAYTGAPAAASVQEGNDLYDKLAVMVTSEITAALAEGA